MIWGVFPLFLETPLWFLIEVWFVEKTKWPKRNWYRDVGSCSLYSLYDLTWTHRIFRIYWVGLLGIGEKPCFSTKKWQYSYHQTIYIGGFNPWKFHHLNRLNLEDSEFWLHLENLTRIILNTHMDWNNKKDSFFLLTVWLIYVSYPYVLNFTAPKIFFKEPCNQPPPKAAILPSIFEAPRIAPDGPSAWAGRKRRVQQRRYSCERLTGNLAKALMGVNHGRVEMCVEINDLEGLSKVLNKMETPTQEFFFFKWPMADIYIYMYIYIYYIYI